MFGLVAADEGFLDLVVLGFGGEDGGFEQEGDVGLGDDLVVEEEVPEFPAALGVVDGIVEADFLEDAAFAPAGAAFVGVGADDVHFDFGGGVAAEAGAVLDEDDLGAVAGGGDGGADPGEAAAGDEEIGLEVDEGHVGFGGGHAAALSGGRDFVELAADGALGGGELSGGEGGGVDEEGVTGAPEVAAMHD